MLKGLVKVLGSRKGLIGKREKKKEDRKEGLRTRQGFGELKIVEQLQIQLIQKV